MAKRKWLIYNRLKRKWWTLAGRVDSYGNPDYWTADRKKAHRFGGRLNHLPYNERAVPERPNRRS